MGNLLSGKMVKWLKWPPDKRIVFLSVCFSIAVILAGERFANLVDILQGDTSNEVFSPRYILQLNHSVFVFLTYFSNVVFVALLMVGWFDKLWLPIFVRVYFFIYAQIMVQRIDGYSLLFFLLDIGPYTLFWSVIVAVTWAIPYHLKMKANRNGNEDPGVGVQQIAYKQSFFIRITWIFVWGIVLLTNSRWIEARLVGIDWSNAYAALFTLQDNEYFLFDVSFDENILAVNMLPSLIWAVIAFFTLIDSFRKDAHFFYAGVWVFTIWHVVKLLVFYFTPILLPGDVDQWAWVPFIVGASILLRAAWGRPLLETTYDW